MRNTYKEMGRQQRRFLRAGITMLSVAAVAILTLGCVTMLLYESSRAEGQIEAPPMVEAEDIVPVAETVLSPLPKSPEVGLPNATDTGEAEAVPAEVPFVRAYEESTLPDTPVMNAVVFNDYLGCSENNFVSVVKQSTGVTSLDEINLEGGEVYIVHHYLRNDCENAAAKNVYVAASFPHFIAAGKTSAIYAEVASENCDPNYIYDDVRITADVDMRLQLVEGSFQIMSNQPLKADDTMVDDFFTDEGLLLSDYFIGGRHNAVEIVYYLEAMPQVTPPAAPEVADFMEALTRRSS